MFEKIKLALTGELTRQIPIKPQTLIGMTLINEQTAGNLRKRPDEQSVSGAKFLRFANCNYDRNCFDR